MCIRDRGDGNAKPDSKKKNANGPALAQNKQKRALKQKYRMKADPTQKQLQAAQVASELYKNLVIMRSNAVTKNV